MVLSIHKHVHFLWNRLKEYRGVGVMVWGLWSGDAQLPLDADPFPLDADPLDPDPLGGRPPG